MANRRSIEQKIEKLKRMATLGLAESEQLLGEDRRHKWSIPDRKIALKYLLAVKPRFCLQMIVSGCSRLQKSLQGGFAAVCNSANEYDGVAPGLG